jgi:hypothetical protein
MGRAARHYSQKTLILFAYAVYNQFAVKLLGNTVNGSPDGAPGNGLPGDDDARLSRKEIQSMAADWQKELDSLLPKTSK